MTIRLKGITVESVLDPCWLEMQAMIKDHPAFKMNLTTGKYQYLYSSKKGKISVLFESRMVFGHKQRFWEILCQEGGLFYGPERFGTRAEAEERIAKLLA